MLFRDRNFGSHFVVRSRHFGVEEDAGRAAQMLFLGCCGIQGLPKDKFGFNCVIDEALGLLGGI